VIAIEKKIKIDGNEKSFTIYVRATLCRISYHTYRVDIKTRCMRKCSMIFFSEAIIQLNWHFSYSVRTFAANRGYFARDSFDV